MSSGWAVPFAGRHGDGRYSTPATPARTAAPAAAGLAPHPAALAPPACRPTLDLPAPTTRPTTHRTPDPGAGTADGPRESPLRLPTHPWRAGRPRPSRGRLDRLEDHKGRRARSRAPKVQPDLAPVPVRPGPRHPRRRLRPRRHRVPAPPLHPPRDRARPPQRAPRRDHRPPHRRLGNPTSPRARSTASVSDCGRSNGCGKAESTCSTPMRTRGSERRPSKTSNASTIRARCDSADCTPSAARCSWVRECTTVARDSGIGFSKASITAPGRPAALLSAALSEDVRVVAAAGVEDG